MSTFFASHWFSNIMVGLLSSGGFWVYRFVRRNRLWREAFLQIARRRPLALAVCVLYVTLGLCDSVAWLGGGNTGSDTVASHQPRSLLDRAFGDVKERSYSAPLARVEFYGGRPLAHPGKHLLGTDVLGRDVLFVTLKGARIALLIGGLTSLIAIPLALFFGVLAGYFGKRLDDAIFFLMSVLASVPGILLLIALIMALGKSTLSVCLALGVTGWVGFCRISRGEAMKLRELDYVHAARALGVSEARIIVRHILPNLMHLIVITFVLTFSSQVLSEAVLSWINIGVDGSWGQMIAQAKDELARDPIIWWNIVGAGCALFGLLLAINMVGDAVRDVLDPRTARENQ